MNETQIISILIGIVGVLLMLLAWSAIYGSDWTTVAQGTAGASLICVFFAIVLGTIWAVIRGRS